MQYGNRNKVLDWPVSTTHRSCPGIVCALQCPHRCVLASQLRKSAVVITAWRLGPFKLDLAGAACLMEAWHVAVSAFCLARPPASLALLPRWRSVMSIDSIIEWAPAPPPIGLPCPSWPYPQDCLPGFAGDRCVCASGVQQPHAGVRWHVGRLGEAGGVNGAHITCLRPAAQ